MKWRAYPAYKDSGIEWLGEIPIDWNAMPLKYACRESALYGANIPASEYTDEGVRFIRTTDVDDLGRLNASNAVYLDPSLAAEYMLEDGELLLSRSGTIGRSFVYDKEKHGDCAYAGYLVGFKPKSMLSSRFAFYFTKAKHFEEWLSLSVISSTIGNVNGQKYANMPLPIPPLVEQHTIAAFLDRKTAHIDTLIAKKERQIELFQEKRAALISHAVTTGLDPNVPMKDSGVEWLGEIPAHWEMKRLKHIISFVTSGSRGWARYYSDSGDVFLRMGNLNRDSIDLDLSEIQHVRPPSGTEGERTQVRPNDILISITAYVGTVGLVPNGLGKAYVNQHTALLRPRHKQVNARWLAHCISSTVVQPQFATSEIGGTKVGIGLDDLRDITLVYPPLGEQENISIYLDSQINRIVRSITKVRESITTLREYRTALISATVTGKVQLTSEVSCT